MNGANSINSQQMQRGQSRLNCIVRDIMKRWVVSPFACFADVHLTYSQQNKQMGNSSINKLPFIFLRVSGRIMRGCVCVCVCVCLYEL